MTFEPGDSAWIIAVAAVAGLARCAFDEWVVPGVAWLMGLEKNPHGFYSTRLSQLPKAKAVPTKTVPRLPSR